MDLFKCQEAQKGVKITKRPKQKLLCEHRIFDNYFKVATLSEKILKNLK